MKRMICLLMILWGGLQWVGAQSRVNPSRTIVEIVKYNDSVELGTFVVAPNVVYSSSAQVDYSPYVSLYFARNKFSDFDNIYVNKRKVFNDWRMRARTFKTGSTMDSSIYVLKNMQRDLPNMTYGSEAVYAFGKQQVSGDSIVDLADDGCVFRVKEKDRMRNRYYYVPFRRGPGKPTPTPITWLEKKIFRSEDQLAPYEKGMDCSRLSNRSIYHISADGHYYYLYRDDFMPNSVLCVDGKSVELFDVYTDDELRLKFSYDGKHWMAVGDGFIWVDGKMKSVQGYSIADFMVTNDGHYICRACKAGEETKGETVVVDGQVIQRDAFIGYFNLNSQQKLKYHFLAAGHCYVYEDGKIKDMTEVSRTALYKDDLIDGQAVKMYTKGGSHYMSYVVGQEGVVIDGKQVAASIPFQVILDEKEGIFRWNAIEWTGDKMLLVVYTYQIGK